MIDLDELERLCREATPGPWDVLDLTEESIEILSLASTVDPQCVVARIANVVSERPIGADDRANAALIAALRNAAPELIAMARRYQFLMNEIDRVDVPPIGRVVWKLHNDRDSCKWTNFATSEDVNAAIDAAMQE